MTTPDFEILGVLFIQNEKRSSGKDEYLKICEKETDNDKHIFLGRCFNADMLKHLLI